MNNISLKAAKNDPERRITLLASDPHWIRKQCLFPLRLVKKVRSKIDRYQGGASLTHPLPSFPLNTFLRVSEPLKNPLFS